MNKIKQFLKEKQSSMAFATCSAVLLYLALTHIPLFLQGLGILWHYFKPVVTGLIVAYIMNPLVKLFNRFWGGKVFKKKKENCKLAHTLSVMCAIISVLALIVVLLIALIPQLVESIMTFVSNLDSYAGSLMALLDQFSGSLGIIKLDITGAIDWISMQMGQLVKKLPENVGTILDVSSNIGGNIFTTVIGCILAIYFLADKTRLIEGMRKISRLIIPAEKYESNAAFWHKCNEILLRYIGCDLLDGLAVGVANFIFMLITRMPYSVLISVVVGVTNLAPTFGPILGAVIGGFVLVLVDPFKALLFLIFTVVIQIVDGYVLKPRLFGATLNVPSVWILVTIVVGGRMFGVTGIMLAIPFAAIVSYFYRDFLERMEKKKEEEVR